MGAVGKVICKVASNINSVVHTVGKAVGETFCAVGLHGVGVTLKDTINTVGDIGQGIAHGAVVDPIGTAAKITIAIVQPELLPLVVAADDVAHGKDLKCVAIDAATAWVGGQIGGAVANQVSGALPELSSSVVNFAVKPLVSTGVRYGVGELEGKCQDFGKMLTGAYVGEGVGRVLNSNGCDIKNTFKNLTGIGTTGGMGGNNLGCIDFSSANNSNLLPEVTIYGDAFNGACYGGLATGLPTGSVGAKPTPEECAKAAADKAAADKAAADKEAADKAAAEKAAADAKALECKKNYFLCEVVVNGQATPTYDACLSGLSSIGCSSTSQINGAATQQPTTADPTTLEEVLVTGKADPLASTCTSGLSSVSSPSSKCEPYALCEVVVSATPDKMSCACASGLSCYTIPTTYNPCTGGYCLEEVVVTGHPDIDSACTSGIACDATACCATPNKPTAKKKWKFPWQYIHGYCDFMPNWMCCDGGRGKFDQRWLNTDPNFLKYKFGKYDKFANVGCKGGAYGATAAAGDVRDTQKLFGELTPCLSSLLKDRLNIGATPQPLEIKPIEQRQEADLTGVTGYAPGGGIVSGLSDLCKCLEKQTASLTSMFANDGVDTLSPIYGAIGKSQKGLNALKQLYPRISDRGNIGMAAGGLPTKYAEQAPEGHNPEFITGITGYYAQGGGTGQSDDIPAMLHDGDYVMDADTVAAFGDGSSKAGAQIMQRFMGQIPHPRTTGSKTVPAKIADGEYVFPEAFVTALGGGDNRRGAKILDAMREELRSHKRSAPTSSIPPKAKAPFEYIKKALG